MPAAPVLSNEAGIFRSDRRRSQKTCVYGARRRSSRCAKSWAITGASKVPQRRIGGSGLWHQVPAFWTTAARAQDATKRPVPRNTTAWNPPASPLVARYPGFNVPDDAVVVREETKTSRSARPRLRRSSSKPAENTRKCEKSTKAKQADLWRAFVALSSAAWGRPPRDDRLPPWGSLDAIGARSEWTI